MLEKYENIVCELDPRLDRDSDAFSTAVLLIAALDVGPNMKRVKKATKYNMSFIRNKFEKLRSNGVFRGGSVYCDWMDEESGGIAFWLDVAVAQGYIRKQEIDELETKATDTP